MSADPQGDTVGQAAAYKRVEGSVRFDWVMIALCSWLLTGVYIDGWAHNHFNIIDTFFTPWHAVLYSGFLSIVIFLAITLVCNIKQGYLWWAAVPPGYGLALLGIVIFGVGGISDFFWHTLFGFDVELATLLSPTHLMLAAGGLLIVGAPLRAAWLRPQNGAKARWFSQLPLILSLTFVLGALAFMTSFAHPFVSLAATSAFHARGTSYFDVYLNDLVESWGVLSIILQTALLIGTMLLIIRRQRVPPGTFTVMLGLSFLMSSVLLGNYNLIPVALLSGLAADGFYWVFKPSAEHVGALRLFVFVVPVCLFLLYFLDLRLFKDVWWPLTVWSGSIVMSGITGLLLSYLFVPPLRGATKPAPSFLTSFQVTRRRVLVGLAGLSVAAGGLMVAGDLLLHRSHPASAVGFPGTLDGPAPFYASGAQAILNMPDLLLQAENPVNYAAWSPDGKLIASANADGTIQIWSAVGKEGVMGEDTPPLTYRKHNKAATCLAWSPDGKRIASASEDGTIQVWRVSTGVTILTYGGHTGRVLAVAWSPGGDQLASAGTDKTVQLWNAATGAHMLTYSKPTEAVGTLAWSPDGKRIASASLKGNALIWDAVSASTGTAFQVDDTQGSAISVVWSPDGRYIATARNTLSVWDASNGSLLSLYQNMNGDIQRVAWSPDGKRFVTGQADGSVYIWTTFTAQKAAPDTPVGVNFIKSGGAALLSGGGNDSSGPFLLLCQGHSGIVNAVGWSPDSQHVVSAGVDATVQVWDTFVGNIQVAYQHKFTSADWSPDGKSIASVVGNSVVEIWDAATARTLVTCTKHPKQSNILCLSWSPDSQQMISASDDGTVLIWDTRTAITLFATKLPRSVVDITWLPGGKHAALVDDKGSVYVWNAATGQIVKQWQLQATGVTVASWSSDKKRLAVVDGSGRAFVSNALKAPFFVSPLPNLRRVSALDWSPDGKHLASVDDGVVQVLDVASGHILFSYQDAQSASAEVTWASDSKRLAFTSYEGVQVWNALDGTLLLTYQGVNAISITILTASWSPDGKRIVSTDNSGSAQIWLVSA